MPHKGPNRGERAATNKKNKAISSKIKKLKGEGKSQEQAVAQAINTVKRKRGPKGAKFT